MAERSDTDDLYGGRTPTTHERMAGQPWDASYTGGPAPWDIGGPQPVVARLASAGAFTGEVLDAGCGTGENALHIASAGLSVLGIDVAEAAVAMAREKAKERGIEAEFAVADAFKLEQLERSFDTVLDVGLFHALDADERRTYVQSLAAVTRPSATVYLSCFSDEGPDTGPHPVSRADLREAFGAGDDWDVVAIEPERVRTRFHSDEGAPAWLATITRC